MIQQPEVSVVVPVFNEESNVTALADRVFKALEGENVELVFVDDGSSDRTVEEILHLAGRDSRIKVVALSRNFGHQVALTAGIDHAVGSAVITLDGDLQHPPEFIPRLLEKWREGYEVVNTRRSDPPSLSILKSATSSLFYWLMRRLSSTMIMEGGADFRLMDRLAVDAFNQMREQDRFVRGLVPWMGFRQTVLGYEALDRYSGVSKYTFRKMLRFALNGVVSFSVRPLRLAFYVGIVTAILGFIYGAYVLYAFVTFDTAPGWTSLIGFNLLWGGVVLIILGIIGEYVGRVYLEVKQRPLYYVRFTKGVENVRTTAGGERRNIGGKTK